jgi:CRP/FNR family transcriptional regulator
MHAVDTASARHARPSPSALPAGQRIADMLARLHCEVPLLHRVLRSGDTVYRAGDRFEALHVVSAGLFKTVKVTADGREQVVGVHFKGDWLGFDGIAEGHHSCEAIAMDTSEVWVIRYDDLLAACSRQPQLMVDVHMAMSGVAWRQGKDALLIVLLQEILEDNYETEAHQITINALRDLITGAQTDLP